MSSLVERPRGDYVLIRVIDHGQTPSGIALPTSAIQGKEFVVEQVGKDVEDLQPGEKVLMVGKQGEDWAYLPNSKELVLLKQANVVLVYAAPDEDAETAAV